MKRYSYKRLGTGKGRRLSPEEMLDRLTQRRWIDPITDCWIWTGNVGHRNRGRFGYGSIWNGARTTTPARESARIHLGLEDGDLRYVCHRCDVPLCFNPAHLFLGTAADNNADAREKGRAYRLPPRSKEQAGEKNAQAKLTRRDVSEIRHNYAHRIESQHELARRFEVTQSLISMIVNNLIWRPEEEVQ